MIWERDILERMQFTQKTGKKHFIVIVAEGAGHAQDLANEIQARTGIDSRATVLGHVQRGGSPTLRDRVTASRMGYQAVILLGKGHLQPGRRRVRRQDRGTMTSTWPCPCTRASTPPCWMWPRPISI